VWVASIDTHGRQIFCYKRIESGATVSTQKRFTNELVFGVGFEVLAAVVTKFPSSGI
jgi:hypothetical protein